MTGDRTTFPVPALLATAGAALAFAGVGAAVGYLGGNSVGMAAGALVMLLAALLLPVPAARGGALLLTWNGLGIATGLFVAGIFSVGALMIFPVALIAVALSSWPLAPGRPVASGPAIVVHIAGFLLALALSGILDDFAASLAGLAGG
jgi:hypothetical protein